MTSNKDFIFSENNYCLFVTFSTFNRIDIFNHEKPRKIFYESLKFCQKTRNLILHAFVIMPDHIHLLISDNDGDAKRLRTTISSLRNFTGRNILKIIDIFLPQYKDRTTTDGAGDRDRMFWVPGWHPIMIASEKFYYQKMNYIHNNPVTAGLVSKAEDWPHSSLYGLYHDGLNDLDVIFS